MTDMIERVAQALREVLWNYGVQLTKEMDELLARAAIEVIRDWQPIETAPKDSEVLILCKQGIRIAHYEPWRAFQWFISLDQTHSGGMFATKPTHWMALPEPPK